MLTYKVHNKGVDFFFILCSPWPYFTQGPEFVSDFYNIELSSKHNLLSFPQGYHLYDSSESIISISVIKIVERELNGNFYLTKQFNVFNVMPICHVKSSIINTFGKPTA